MPASQGLPELVAELKQNIEAHTERLRALARTGQAGGSPEWDAFLEELPVPRLSPEQRRDHLESGAPLQCGALPIEVRRVLAHWCKGFEQQARRLQNRFIRESDQSPELRAAEETLDRIDHLLGTYVEREVKAHLEAVRPSPVLPGRSSIFQNALRSTPRWGGTAANVATLSCHACGAPRFDESAQSCGFCGSALFG